MNAEELKQKYTELKQTVEDFGRKIEELKKPEEKPLEITEPCWVRCRDGETSFVLKCSPIPEFPWQCFNRSGIANGLTVRRNGTVSIIEGDEQEVDVFEILRPLTEQEMVAFCRGEELSFEDDFGEIWDGELEAECQRDGWVYMGASSERRRKKRPDCKYECRSKGDLGWRMSTPFSDVCDLSPTMHYRRKAIQ